MEKKNKKHGILSNYFYIYHGLWQFDKKTIFLAVAEILFQVATAFGAIWMSSEIIHMLEVGMNVREMILTTIKLFVGYGIIAAIARYLLSRNEWQYIEYRGGVMIRKALRKVMSMDYGQYEREDIQKLVQKSEEAVKSNISGIEGILHRTVILLTDILGLILYCVVISEVHPLVIVLLIGISLIQIGTFRLADAYELRNKEKKAELQIHQDYLDRQAYEINAGKDIRLYQLQDWLTKRYMQVNRCYQHLIARERIGYFANDLIGLILQFSRDSLCYGYLIYRLQQGMSASRFVLYIGVVSGFSTYFTSMTSEITEITRYNKLVKFYRETMDIKSEFHHGDGKRLDSGDSALEIEFSHVTYCYPGTDKKVLDDLSFRMRKGEKLALVGINGAGKTTIVKLMCGFYRPQSGHIYVNGIIWGTATKIITCQGSV